jgi:hypothetical protein
MTAGSDRLFLFSFALFLVSGLFQPRLSQADIPQSPATSYDQAVACKVAYDGVKGVHDSSLRSGIVLWTCGDVPGVTGPDTGQEYCQYNAVSGGRIVRTVGEIAPNGRLQCVFTAVFSDTEGKDAKLLDAMAAPENFGERPQSASVVRMTLPDNSRKTAQSVIESCSADASDGAQAANIDELRQVACFQAAASADSGSDRPEKLREICRGQDLSDETRWAKSVELGAKVLKSGEEGFEEQRDLVGCVALKRLGRGVPWRNSDLRMCGRVRRASEECGCRYDAIPSSLDGFSFSGWVSPILGAIGCRKAKVDGSEYDHIVICEIPQAEVGDLELDLNFAENLPAFCLERFENVLPVRAPIRTFQKSGQCTESATPFCAAHSGSSP